MQGQLLQKSQQPSSIVPLEDLYYIKPTTWDDLQFNILYQGYKQHLSAQDIYNQIQSLGNITDINEIQKVLSQVSSLNDANQKVQPIHNQTQQPAIKKKVSNKIVIAPASQYHRRLRNRQVQSSQERQSKQYQYDYTNSFDINISLRKVRPQTPNDLIGLYDPEQRLQLIEVRQKQCIVNQDQPKKTSKKQQFNRKVTVDTWVQIEFFLPNFDKAYYLHNDFAMITEYIMKSSENQRGLIKFGDFKLIQAAFGRVPLFQKQFYLKERQNIQYFRDSLRSYLKSRNINDLPDFTYPSYFKLFDSVTPLSITRPVVAIHPTCKHIHQGTVMGMLRQNYLIIKFLNPQLGAYKIPDYHIASDYDYLLKKMPHVKTMSIDNIKRMDHFSTIAQFKLLQIKSSMIFHLKELGKQLQKFKLGKTQPSDSFKEQYGYTCFIIELTDILLKYLFKVARQKCSYTKKEALNTLTIGGGNFMTMIQRDLEIGAYQAQQQINISTIKLIQKQRQIQNIVSQLWKQTTQQYFQQQDTIKSMLAFLLQIKTSNRLNIKEIKKPQFLSFLQKINVKQHTQLLYEVLIGIQVENN